MSISPPPIHKIQERQVISLVLLLGLVHGFLYVFLMPPWQHYDEPGHFEYAWLIANRPGLPAAGEFDLGLRREVAASMIEHGFFKEINARIDLLSPVEPTWIGSSQTGDVPLYYGLVSIPLRVLRGSDVAFQLYIGRMISLSLLLITLAGAYGALRAITPPQHPLNILIPLSMALMPGFIDLMTALNNDVGAVAAFTIFLWLSLIIIQRGISVLRILALAFAVAVCLLTKSTAAVALPLGLLALFLGGLRSTIQKRTQPPAPILIAGPALLLLVLTVSFFGWGGARHWASLGVVSGPIIAPDSLVPGLGKNSFHLEPTNNSVYIRLVQPVDSTLIPSLAGQTVTVGAWIWGERVNGDKTQVRSPTLEIDGQWHYAQVEVMSEPLFFSLVVQVPENVGRINILLAPGEEIQTANSIFYEGVTLALGEFPANESPQYADVRASRGTWAGVSFTNLVKNPSAENVGLRIRPWIAYPLTKLLSADPSVIFLSLDNFNLSISYYRETMSNLLQTFWGRFGWGHITMELGSIRPYWPLTGFSLIGVAASAAWIISRPRRIPWGSVSLLTLALVLVWSLAALRGIHSLIGFIFIPAARYAFPAILPTTIAVFGGWYAVWRWISLQVERRQQSTHSRLVATGWLLYGLFFLMLNIIAIWSIIQYYA